MMVEPTLLLAFLSGVLTITTPCCLVMIPTMIAGSAGNRSKPVFIVLGSSVSFTLMGGVFSAVGITFSGFGNFLKFISSWIIIALGATMVDRELNAIYVGYTSLLLDKFQRVFRRDISKTENPYLSSFALGASLGTVWIPCVGPILGSILAYVAYQKNILYGSVLLFAYSVGFGVSLLGLIYLTKHSAGRVAWFKRNSEKLYKLAGWVLIAMGLAILFGLYKYMQRYLYPFAVYLEEWLLLR